MNARLAFLPVLILLSAGCSKSTTTMPTQPAAAAVLKVTPADGATAVRLDAGITLDFGVAVNRPAVESGFRLISEADMTGSCPDASMGSHGSMNAVMADPVMLAHMDAVHATHGRFSWNDAGTVCTFAPDSLMRSQTRYMTHMSRSMLDMMARMGGTMGPGQMTGSGEMVAHFQTITDDGHSGHH